MNVLNSKNILSTIAFAALFTAGIFAANAQQITIPIETKSNALVLQVSPENYLNMVYFGKKLPDQKEYALPGAACRLSHNRAGYSSGYPPPGAGPLPEPARAVTHAAGNP